MNYFVYQKTKLYGGGNYFTKYLPGSMGWIFWYKCQRICSSDGELAFTSFQKALRVVEYTRFEIPKNGGAIHPTQKPVALYSWIIQKYAKQGDKILDTHLGSGSISLAIDKANKLDNMNLSFVGIELDKEYFDASIARFKDNSRQSALIFE